MASVGGSPPQPAAPPTRVEIERKLSMRSASPADVPRRARSASNTNIHAGSLSSSAISGGYYPQSGNESDSSTHSIPIPPTGTFSNSAASPIVGQNSITGGILTAIAETESGGFAEEEGLSDSVLDQHDGEDEASDDGDVEMSTERGTMGGELEKGMQVERVLKSGYLMKKGERRKNWQKRWFVLRTEKLAYYKDDKEYVMSRILTLREIHSIVPVQLKRHQNVFGIVTSRRTYYVQAGNRAEVDSWVEALQEAKRSWAEGQTSKAGAGPSASSTTQPTTMSGPTTTMSQPAMAKSPSVSGHITTSRPAGAFAEAPFGGAMSPTSNSAAPLESPMARLGLGIAPPTAPSASSHERVRPSGARTSNRRNPSISSLSSSAGGGLYGRSLGDPAADVGGVTSSEDEDAFAMTSEQAQAGPGPSSLQGQMQDIYQPIQSDPNKVILAGYLMKKGMQRRTWRKRWFVLTSGALMYTTSHMDHKVHRQIPLSDVLDAIEIDGEMDLDLADDDSEDGQNQGLGHMRRGRTRDGRDKHKTVEHGFQVITPKRTFRLCAPSEEDEIKWLAALRALINRERGLTSPVGSVPPPFPSAVPLGSMSISQSLDNPLPPLPRLESQVPGSYFPTSPNLNAGTAPQRGESRRASDLPPILTTPLPRTRSATQSARSAITEAVKRFGESSSGHASTQHN